ncbi:MAG: WYL domain-containing protein [Microbacteriaceae bacterium]
MSSASSPARVPVEERLFSLVLALLATETGLTKNEILSTVQGYRQRYSTAGENTSLERQFERDKDDIRELGVPLETVETSGESGNNQNLRYRIPKGSYDLPADIRFSPNEITLLSLAATVWREGSLSRESRRAIMKLHALGVESEAPIIGYAPRLRAREAAFDPLSVALERKTVVTFLYLKPGEPAPRRRTVEPLALVQHLGRWHLHGIDRDVGQSRTFLLSRIVDAVTPTGSVFEPEGTDFATRALDELQAIWLANLAEVDVVPDTDAAARLGKRYGAPAPGQTRLAVHYSDINILADELAGYGPEVLVLSPDALREHVMNRLRATIAAHRDDESGSGGDDG